jgi:hypothetical protein
MNNNSVERLALAYQDFVVHELGMDPDDDDSVHWIREQPSVASVYDGLTDAGEFAILVCAFRLLGKGQARQVGAAMVDACTLPDGARPSETISNDKCRELLDACRAGPADPDDRMAEVMFELEADIKHQKVAYFPDSYLARAILSLSGDSFYPLLDALEWLYHLGSSSEDTLETNNRAFLDILKQRAPLSAFERALAP